MNRRRARVIIMLLWAAAVFMVIAIFWFYTGRAVRPIYHELAIDSIQHNNEKLVSNAIYEILQNRGTRQDDLVQFERDDENNITAVTMDSVYLNRLRSQIVTKVNEGLRDYKSGSVGIRLGSLVAPGIFAGRGPRIPFRYEVSANVFVDFNGEFESQGINQSKHRLMMVVRTDLRILSPALDDERAATVLKNEVMLNETIVVGRVPDTYANVEIGARG